VGLAPLLAKPFRVDDLAEIVFFVILFIVWVVTRLRQRGTSRGPAEEQRVPAPQAPPPSQRPSRRAPGVPPPAAPAPLPSPPRGGAASTGGRREEAHEATGTEPGSGDARIKREDAPAADFDAVRDISKRTAAVEGATSRAGALSGRALLRAGDLPRRDRVRAAVLWSEVLGPPVSRRGPSRRRR
jgi:hypothetical protein